MREKVCRKHFSYSLCDAYQSFRICNEGTVRSNIVMGAAYDPVFYSEVVEACGLSHDFKQFSSGDDTIVGDRGVQCSGGQKARSVDLKLSSFLVDFIYAYCNVIHPLLVVLELV